MSSIHAIYGSTSGHTEFVIDTLIEYVKGSKSGISIEKQRAESAKPDDLMHGDVLLLASGSWNTGSIEGQLNPHMHELLKKRAADVDLQGKKVLLVGLGDDRYHFTVGCMDHLLEFVAEHNGEVIEPVLKVVNEPYGQEQKVQEWADAITEMLQRNISTTNF